MSLVVVKTPLRVSFFGGGSDLPFFYREEGGGVLGTAVDKFTYVIIKDRFDDLIYANWMKKEIVSDLSALEHGLIRESLRHVGLDRGVEVTTLADVPATGTGLGSSSSITVGLLLAASTLRGLSPSRKDLAEQACAIEIDRLHSHAGKQDQYFAAYGGVLALRFEKDDSVDVGRVPMGPAASRALEERVLLFYSGTTRESGPLLEAVTASRRARDDLRRLRDMAIEGASALREADWSTFGALLDESWARKRSLAVGVTTKDIDDIYERAKSAGATGGKVTGAGGGGFLVFFVDPAKRDAVRTALRGLREVPFRISHHGASVVYFEADQI